MVENRNKKWSAAGFAAGILTAVFLYILFCISTGFLGNPGNNVCYLGIALLTAVLYIMTNWAVWKSAPDSNMQTQMDKLNAGLCLTAILYTASAYLDQKLDNKWVILAGMFMLTAASAYVIGYRIRKKSQSHQFEAGKLLKKAWKEYNGLLLLLLVCFFLAVQTDCFPYKWDSALYYNTCQNINLFSITSLAIYGHMAQGFGSIIKIAGTLLGSLDAGIVAANTGLYLLSICAFYGILKNICKGCSKTAYLSVTGIYAFSPFVLGMVNYLSLDFYTQCLFMLLVYFVVKREWILQFPAALLFCFTKEPAIVIYAFLCFGVLVYDLFVKRKEKGNFFGKIISEKKYWLMAFCGVLWLVTFLMLGPWNAGNSEMGISLAYIFKKLKVLYLLNFNWLLTLLTIGFCVFCIRDSRKKEMQQWFLPLGFAQMSFTVFSCLFRTANHPRYADSTIVFLCICSGCLLLNMGRYWRYLLTAFMVPLMLISSFWTIDPVSRLAFSHLNLGNGVLLTTSENGPVGDAAIYNKQMMWLEQPIGKAIEDALEEDAVILFASLKNNIWYFDGMNEFHTIPENEYILATCFWDKEKKCRVLKSDENCEEIEIYELSDGITIQKLQEDIQDRTKYSYIYTDLFGGDRVDEIKDNYQIIESSEHHYRGFVVHQLIFANRNGVQDE